ncbi:MAG: lipid-A-disaccharide synthase [Rhodocyclaceae bacterium]|nr:lipid-A-disaccharide synthase [Rhodocyclaceae bacterium]
MMTRIAMVAGEASSDQLAAHLIAALKTQRSDISFYGIGGPKMEREGFNALWPAEKLSVRGYAEVLRHYREISGIRRQLLKRVLADKPSAFIGVDGSDFNLWLEKKLKRAGIPVIHFVSPSIWAWRKNRLKKIVQSVDHLLALFPFEPALYANTPVKCTFVGHPMADVIAPEIKQAAVRESLEIAADKQVVALLPGSRQSELQYMAETFIEAAKLLLLRFPKIQFLVPLISRETRLQFEIALWKCKADDLPFTLMFGHATEAIAASDAVLVASGTATLETALVGRPMVIAYKMSPWTHRIMLGMGYLPWIGLPNILARRFVVPEFIQDDATPENLAQALGNILLDKPVRRAVEKVFADIHVQLRQDTGQQAAKVVLPYLGTA